MDLSMGNTLNRTGKVMEHGGASLLFSTTVSSNFLVLGWSLGDRFDELLTAASQKRFFSTCVIPKAFKTPPAAPCPVLVIIVGALQGMPYRFLQLGST